MTDDALVARLRAAGCVFAEDEAAALSAAAPDVPWLERMVERRIAGEPLEVILGYAEFAGLRIPVVAGVFVPRRRTELVARLAAEAASHSATVVDLCCGTGAIAAAIAHARPDLAVWAADSDPAAVALASATLAAYGATALVSDMDSALPGALAGAVAVVAACPPYVPSAELDHMPPEARDHEPRAALDGGEDGTALQQRVFEAATRLLAPEGVCVVETSEHLATASLAAAARAGLRATLERDDALDAVVVVCRL